MKPTLPGAFWAVVVIAAMTLLAGKAAAQTRPNPTPIQTDLLIGLPGDSWEAVVQDTTIGTSWQRVETGSGITQPTTPDSLRIFSSSEADSSKFAVVFLKNSTYLPVTVQGQLSGADSVFIGTDKAYKLLGVFMDTTSAGTISIKAKTGTSNLAQIAPGKLETSLGQYYFGAKQGSVTELCIYPSPFSPMVEFQVRLYRSHVEPVATPEVGYSILFNGTTGGLPILRPQVSKQIVSTDNDTGATMFLASPGTSYVFATVVTSVGTSNQAYYVQSSPDGSTWNTGTAIDSLSSGSALSANLRYSAVTLNSATGPYHRFIVNGKAASGDTSTTTTYVFPATWNANFEPIVKPMKEACPTYSYVVVYARALGTNGKLHLGLKGTVSR